MSRILYEPIYRALNSASFKLKFFLWSLVLFICLIFPDCAHQDIQSHLTQIKLVIATHQRELSDITISRKMTRRIEAPIKGILNVLREPILQLNDEQCNKPCSYARTQCWHTYPEGSQNFESTTRSQIRIQEATVRSSGAMEKANNDD